MVRVGTCGYRYYDGDLADLSREFDAVELNSTFYSLPDAETLRERADTIPDDADFSFTMKGWQALTHPSQSPTWNGERDSVSDDILDDCGYLRDNEAVREAWRRTRDRAEALGAELVLVQTPPSFDCTDEHAEQMRGLLSSIDRGDLTLAWEPRGDWPDNPDRVASLCADLDLVHVVDPLHAEPRDDHPVAYCRFHGEGESYEYDYADDELRDIAAALPDGDPCYAMFNNDAKFDNGRTLMEFLA